MGYTKAIIYGKNLELYTYEKNINFTRGSRAGSPRRAMLQDMASGGSVELQLRKVQKRQDNIGRARLAFRRLVLSNLDVSAPPALVTCTYSANQTDTRVAYEDFRSFIGNLRYRFGRAFRYISVLEFQKRGAIHFHTLFWGLPPDLCAKERHTRLVASLWGRGFVDCYLTDGDERLASYLAKYMSKSYVDLRLVDTKAYRCSRNIRRPLVEKNLSGTWYLQERYNLGSTVNIACVDKTFQSRWLGEGRYRLYKNISV